MPPDLYLRAESFSFQLQDNPFESNFKSNHMVCSGCEVGGAGFVKWVVQGVWSGRCRRCYGLSSCSVLVAAAG